MNYYISTKYNKIGSKIDLISIGIISEDKKEYKSSCNEFREEDCDKEALENVIPKLTGERKSIEKIREEIIDFIQQCEGEKPESTIDIIQFYSNNIIYDGIILERIIGVFPKGWKNIISLQQEQELLQLPKKLIPTHTNIDDSLACAEYCRRLHKNLIVYEAQKAEEGKIRHCDILFDELKMMIKSYEVNYNNRNEEGKIELILKLDEKLKVINQETVISRVVEGGKVVKKGIKSNEFIHKSCMSLILKEWGLGIVLCVKEFKFRNEHEYNDRDYWLTTLCREMLSEITTVCMTFIQLNKDAKRDQNKNLN